MKKIITKIALALGLAVTISGISQTVSFESFTLTPNSYYQNNAGTDFSENGVSFQYGWAGYWESGSAYTNINDTVTGSYTNLYGNITGTAFSGTNYATLQSGAMISLSNTTTAISGFYITNTTYAWKAIKKGNQFSRRFGDTTGTGKGSIYAQGEYPDWFKLSILGYRNGSQLTDTVHFYLADYRVAGTANDYVVKNWQFVNCISLGQVDSLRFEMESSDTSGIYLNTPAFFSIDNLITQSTVGINELSTTSNVLLFPNPASQAINLSLESSVQNQITLSIFDISGNELQNQTVQTLIGKNNVKINTESLDSGIYFIEIKEGTSSKTMKFIKL
jgi:hypothetical protein